MPAAKKRPGDLTGRQAEILAAEKKEELAKREAEISLTQQVDREILDNPVDLTNGADPDDILDMTEDEELVIPEVTVAPVVVAPPAVEKRADVHVEKPMRTFRVNSDIDDMTFGAGNTFSLKMGQKYTAPKALYDHLYRLGYIANVL